MATGPGVNQGKSAFLEKFLDGNRDAKMETVNKAWNAAGNEGTISESLFGKTRSKLGLTGKRRAMGGASKGTGGPAVKVKPSPKGSKGASKSAGAPSPSNGLAVDTGPSKSAFVEEMLGRNPESNLKAVNDAWASAGGGGSISPSIFYKVKREWGEGAGSTLAAPVKTKAKSVSRGPKSKPATQPSIEVRPDSNREPVSTKPVGSMPNERERVLDRVEDGIDDLIIELKRLGGMEEALEWLRKVRRVVVRSHEG